MIERSEDTIIINIKNEPDVGDKYPLNLVTELEAQRFWEKHKLPIELSVLIRGFLAFQHRAGIEWDFHHLETVPHGMTIGDHEYTETEVQALWNAWNQSKLQTLFHISRLHWLLITACVFAAMTQGWDQAAMAGAAVQVMKALGRPVSPTITSDEPGSKPIDNANLDKNTWLLGFLVGAPFLCGAPIGLLVTDRLTEIWQFGRRGAICVAGLFSFISVIGSASVHNIYVFLFFRVFLGVGMAGKASIVPILLSETSPKNVRGILLVFWQLFVAFGLAAGSIANLSVYHLNEGQSWRYMFISAFIPALLLFSLVLFSPESPRWLLKKSGLRKTFSDKEREDSKARVRDALKSLIELHNEPTPIVAAGELILLYKRLVEEQRHFPQHFSSVATTSPLDTPIAHVSWRTRWSLMLRKGPMRRANYAAAAVMSGQQLCGINLLAFLSDHFFRNSFFKSSDPPSGQNQQLLAFSLGFGVWNFVSTIPALFFIDTSNGRRTLLNWSFPCMAISLLISALILLVPSTKLPEGKVSGVVAAMHFTFLALFTTAYSIGEGPAAFVISAEVFPLVNRELGMSLGVFWNFLLAGLLAQLAPWLTKSIGQFGMLVLFSGFNIPAWAASYFLVPSTGNEDLEDVFRRFDVPTKFALIYTLVSLRNKFQATTVDLLHYTHLNGDTVSLKQNLKTVEEEWAVFKEISTNKIGLRATWHALDRSEAQQETEMFERGNEQGRRDTV